MIVIEAREVACKLPKAEDLPALASQKPHIWMEKSVVRLFQFWQSQNERSLNNVPLTKDGDDH